MKDNSLLSFITGAAVGAALGILFAPEKGEVTRRKVLMRQLLTKWLLRNLTSVHLRNFLVLRARK